MVLGVNVYVLIPFTPILLVLFILLWPLLLSPLHILSIPKPRGAIGLSLYTSNNSISSILTTPLALALTLGSSYLEGDCHFLTAGLENLAQPLSTYIYHLKRG